MSAHLLLLFIFFVFFTSPPPTLPQCSRAFQSHHFPLLLLSPFPQITLSPLIIAASPQAFYNHHQSLPRPLARGGEHLSLPSSTLTPGSPLRRLMVFGALDFRFPLSSFFTAVDADLSHPHPLRSRHLPIRSHLLLHHHLPSMIP